MATGTRSHDESQGREASETTPLLSDGPSAPSRTTNVVDDIDSRFRRWKQAVAHRMKHGKQKLPDEPTVLISVFEPCEEMSQGATPDQQSYSHFFEDVEGVKAAIKAGILPKMITTGSSGSYFARLKDHQGRIKICGVFKPADEEPYGNLNPKRAFLRRYFWWAMGRPCLIAGFSAMSEAGASLLDDRLQLSLVPATRLVALSSPSFHYAYKDRMAHEHHGEPLPEKSGSFQSFLHGYTMASTFLRSHPFPTRPRSVLERDLAAEQKAHRKSRKQYKARLRKFFVKLKYVCLCRQGIGDIQFDASTDIYPEDLREEAESSQSNETEQGEDEFLWTPELIQAFRLELEKLVVFDYLCRNTDRGLDNFMVKYVKHCDASDPTSSPTVRLGAIDNSLAWPIKHPDGIREYPFGWLYLPADLIGGPFAQSTRDQFIPILSSAHWWHETETCLRQLFEQDEHFNMKLFESQMAVFKGQGFNLLHSLQSPEEGPLELCARPKKVVHKSVVVMTEEEMTQKPGSKVLLSRVQGSLGTRLGPQEGESTSKVQPISVKIERGRQPERSSSSAEALHPSSLPETSTLALRDDTERRNTGAVAAGSSSAHPGSLGIEVLEAMNKTGRKHFKRSQSQQGQGFFDRNNSRPNVTQANSTDRANEPLTSPRWGRHNSRRFTRRRPDTSRRDSSGANAHDILSEDEEDRYEEEQRHDRSSESMSQSLLTEPEIVDETHDERRRSARERMASSDYFANYHRKVTANDPMPSIDRQLSDQQALEQPSRENEQQSDKKRMNLDKSQSYSPSTTLTHQQESSGSRRGIIFGRRRRMKSVGQWSISSFGSMAFGSDGRDAEQEEGEGQTKPANRKIKAIVEKLVDDRALPWQAWLRA